MEASSNRATRKAIVALTSTRPDVTSQSELHESGRVRSEFPIAARIRLLEVAATPIA